MRGYSENRDENLSRIRLLEDADGDGQFDKSTIFAEGLAWPTAIHCWRGGVLVADAPDILYFKDTDGDGKADERKVLFTGFGRSNVQGLLNSFTWGLDNRIYGATSSSGAQVTRPGDDATPAARSPRPRLCHRAARHDHGSRSAAESQHGLSINNWGSDSSRPIATISSR